MFVAGFIGAPQMNFLQVTVRRVEGRFKAEFDGLLLPLPDTFSASTLSLYENRQCTLGLRPEYFHEKPPLDVDADMVAPVDVLVELSEPMGSEVHLNATLGGHPIIARVGPRCGAGSGDTITLYADLSTAHLFDNETEAALASEPALERTLA